MSRRLLITYLALAAVALAAVAVPLALTYSRSQDAGLETSIERDATTIASLAQGAVGGGPAAAARVRLLEDFIRKYQGRTGARVVITNRVGTVVADSDPAATRPRQIARSAEVSGALAGERTTSRTRSETLDSEVVVVAVPIAAAGRVSGAVRVGFPVAAAQGGKDRFWLALVLLCATVLIAVAVAGRALAQWMARPLQALSGVAARLGRGDLGSRADTNAGPPEVRTVASAFNTTADRLERVLTAQRQFVSDAAHELRTPLGVLRLRLENLSAHPLPREAQKEANASVGELARLTAMIDGLLDLAKVDADAAAVEAIDLAAMARARVEDRRARDHANEVRITHSVQGQAFAWSRLGAVEQIVDNLLDNAVRAAGPRGQVVISTETDGEWAVLRVGDSGPGLSAADRTRAFERFWRGATDSEGSGLGLPLVKRFAEASGGDASLEDSALGGLQVTVRLRRVSGSETQAKAVRSPRDTQLARS